VVGAYYADIRYKNIIPRYLKKVLMEYNSTPCTEWTTWPENISVHLGAHPILKKLVILRRSNNSEFLLEKIIKYYTV
jgi:hypothetical protein